MRRDDAVALLRNGIVPTAQRVDIASVLLARPQHVCAEDVHRMLVRDGTPVSRATVYNTLGLFARKGMVHELVVGSDRVLYDSNTASHDHLYDVDTGTLTDIEPGAVVVDALPSLPAGTRVERVDVVIRVCRSRPA
jgi:Fur family iron response transcriptional regulator